MKILWGAVCILMSSLVLAAEKKTLPGVASHAELAYRHMRSLPIEERTYMRYLSYYNIQDPVKRVKTMRFWLNNLHLETAVSFPAEVPGSNGQLYVLDLRDYGWNAEAFSRVARKEPYFREPFVDSSLAILLRGYLDIKQDPETYHVEAIVRADWFFRETMESDRSKAYYELLFAKIRVKEANFPKNEADFERVFAVDKFREHLKEFKIDTRHGAVVEGMEKGVSIVARQNRLIERIITSTGSYYKTFDVKETSGSRDFVETLNKDFEFDAGEILADLPAGGMAALLVDNKGTIVEAADNRFATDTSDVKYDARVRTPGSCFICHEQKYIKPQNLIEEFRKAGIDILFKKKEEQIAAKGFFLDWDDKLEAEQTRFGKFVTRTSGFKTAENASNLLAWRNEYDSPIKLTVAALEAGLTEEAFKAYAIKSTKARVMMLLRGMSIPRKTWEADVYKEINLLINASRK